ncbi:hypothetical protein EYR02_17955 [Xanthomonas oryzae pv. oryzae]|nr:hypothetical protein EYR02_17955 [Xanthomonas oryzae pv. oryzae]
MICSSEKRFFTSNLLGIGNWTPNQGATQNRGDVAPTAAGYGEPEPAPAAVHPALGSQSLRRPGKGR